MTHTVNQRQYSKKHYDCAFHHFKCDTPDLIFVLFYFLYNASKTLCITFYYFAFVVLILLYSDDCAEILI